MTKSIIYFKYLINHEHQGSQGINTIIILWSNGSMQNEDKWYQLVGETACIKAQHEDTLLGASPARS